MHAVHQRSKILLRRPETLLEMILFDLEQLDLVPLALAGVVGRQSVTLHTLDPTLFLFILRLCTFAGREVCLWLGQLLTPRLALPVGFGSGRCRLLLLLLRSVREQHLVGIVIDTAILAAMCCHIG